MISVDAGYYNGKIVDYGISEARSSGQPQAFIEFEVIDGVLDGQPCSTPPRLKWFGGLATKASKEGDTPPIEWTVKTLLDCEFSSEAVENMAAGPASECLKIGHEMSLTIEDNEWDGKVSSRIKWVNIKGSTGAAKKMSHEEAAGKLNTSALRAVLLREKQKRATGADVPKVPL